IAPVRLPGTRPSELLTVAVTGGRPTASSTGNVTRVPEPTTALIPPATNPAAATASISQPVIGASRGSLAHARRSALGGKWPSVRGVTLGNPALPAPRTAQPSRETSACPTAP